jgi:pantoate--beta-alanine ligase
MRVVADSLSVGVDLEEKCDWGSDELVRAGFERVDYFVIRDNETLRQVDGFRPGLRLFAAAWLGETRLIDNIEIDKIK